MRGLARLGIAATVALFTLGLSASVDALPIEVDIKIDGASQQCSQTTPCPTIDAEGADYRVRTNDPDWTILTYFQDDMLFIEVTAKQDSGGNHGGNAHHHGLAGLVSIDYNFTDGLPFDDASVMIDGVSSDSNALVFGDTVWVGVTTGMVAPGETVLAKVTFSSPSSLSSPMPEPGSMLLFAVGALAITPALRKRFRSRG